MRLSAATSARRQRIGFSLEIETIEERVGWHWVTVSPEDWLLA